MKKSLAVGGLVLCAFAGCTNAPQDGPQPTSSTSSAIQGGMDDPTHQFAVGIVVFPMGLNAQGMGQAAFCSGALLAPNLVATARHCAAQISSTMIDCSTATFGTDYGPGQIVVTTDETINPSSTNFVQVSQIVTPTPTPVCGDDLALLILASNIDLPAYVSPVLSPPMTDHGTYSTNVTAIGYGVSTPTDTTGTTAGTRRIRQDIAIECIPGDPTLVCPSTLSGQVDPTREFVVTDGTCEGDSGSSAFDEKSFDQGVWKSFGVLSRGGVSTDGQTCEGSIYTRFDQYSELLVQTAQQAAQAGNYSAPVWAGGAGVGGTTGGTSSVSSSTSDAGGTSGGLGDGASCTANSDCSSNNCVTADNGKTYFCASSCNTSSDCSSGFSCEQGYCVSQSGNASQGSSGGKGCSISPFRGPTDRVPGRGVLAGVAGLGIIGLRRRKRRK